MRFNEPMFQPLDDSAARWSRFGPSLAGHVLLVAAAIAIPVSVVQEQPGQHRKLTALIVPRPLPRPVVRVKRAPAPVAIAQVKQVALPVRRVAVVPVRVAPIGVQPKIDAAPAPLIVPAGVVTAAMPGPAPLAPFVRTGGFGEAGVGTGTAKPVMQKVAMGGFADPMPVAPATTHVVQKMEPVQTPVEITYKPKPVYTEQARAQHVEGEVQLEVVFCASGAVQVVRIVKSLGTGLDESAREAAIHIRFHPATRGGAPVDVRGVIHIAFELS